MYVCMPTHTHTQTHTQTQTYTHTYIGTLWKSELYSIPFLNEYAIIYFIGVPYFFDSD